MRANQRIKEGLKVKSTSFQIQRGVATSLSFEMALIYPSHKYFYKQGLALL